MPIFLRFKPSGRYRLQARVVDHTVEPSVIHRAIHRWGAEVIEFHLDIDSKGDEYSAGPAGCNQISSHI